MFRLPSIPTARQTSTSTHLPVPRRTITIDDPDVVTLEIESHDRIIGRLTIGAASNSGSRLHHGVQPLSQYSWT
jgi:hypothetical protein